MQRCYQVCAYGSIYSLLQLTLATLPKQLLAMSELGQAWQEDRQVSAPLQFTSVNQIGWSTFLDLLVNNKFNITNIQHYNVHWVELRNEGHIAYDKPFCHLLDSFESIHLETCKVFRPCIELISSLLRVAFSIESSIVLACIV